MGSQPVSGNVTPSFRLMSTIECVEGEHGETRRKGVVVIICAYEEGSSSLGASSWQLL